MDEYVRRHYLKEEEFLEEHYETVDAILPALGGRWQPNYRCNDLARQRQDMLFASGKLTQLTFIDAAVFYNAAGMSSIRVNLCSSDGLIVARIHWANGEAIVELLADSPRKERRVAH